MKKEELIIKKIGIAEKAVQELIQKDDLKKLPEQLARQVAGFYETKSLNRLKSAKIVYEASQKNNQYTDYSETVAAAYYAMYYIVHAYLAAVYKTKMREDLKGVHAITHNLVLYYLVKTNKLAKHLYDEYIQAFQTTTATQNLTISKFQEKAYAYAEKYDDSRAARETFTYKTTASIEEYHAKQAISTADEFINTIRQLIIKK
jgi:uncharacterized protein (UPF0332 family)